MKKRVHFTVVVYLYEYITYLIQVYPIADVYAYHNTYYDFEKPCTVMYTYNTYSYLASHKNVQIIKFLQLLTTVSHNIKNEG